MPTGYEELTIAEMVEARLRSDATLAGLIPDPYAAGKARVFPYAIPQEDPNGPSLYPAITYGLLGPLPDAVAEGGERQQVTMDYWFSVHGKGLDVGAIADAKARMDHLLQQASGNFAHGTIARVLRMGPWGPLLSPVAGQQFIRSGGRYRIYLGVD